MDEIGNFELFDSKAILLISSGVMSCSIIFVFLYKYMIIRYILAAILCLVAIVQRKAIVDMIKLIRKR